MGVVLALIGLGFMVGFAGAGSAWGLAITGQAVMGLTKKRPEAFGTGLAMAAAPATQGLYGFVGYVIYSGVINPGITVWQGGVVLGAGLAMGIACFISAIHQGRVCASGIAAYASGSNVFGQTMVLAAFPEFYAILSLVVAILMQGLMTV